jgi:hypothetical protein
MGFFSDLMKNPFVQMALPMALSYFMPGIGSLIGTSAISNPMMRSAAEQALLGYGTAKLTGSKHPEKAAMYSGLASMPFSFMKAQGAANTFNKQYAGKDPSIYNTVRDTLTPGRAGQEAWWEKMGPAGMDKYHPAVTAVEPTYSPWRLPEGVTTPEKLTAWDVLEGDTYNIPPTRNLEYTGLGDPVFNEAGTDLLGYRPETAWDTALAAGDISEGIIPGQTDMEIPVDFYSKIGKGQKNLLGATLEEGETYPDFTPTIASQTAGWYGGRPTEEEEWEDAKSRRRKELAFMYGIDESLMGGELENPYYTGGGFWKDGGIAALQMDNGGAVDGPGGPKDDVIDAKLSDGEFVMTAKAVENLGGGDRLAGAKRMYNMMNQLDPQSETVGESVIGV